MDLLKPTVKRDVSLFTTLSWQKGYLHYFKQKFGWSYPIYFHYNGRQVNFYHKQTDFKYFKEVITQNLINTASLFEKLNQQFQKDVYKLETISQKITSDNLSEIFNLGGKIISFYVFVVSDSFVAAIPKAWESRHLSQEILYQVDEAVERRVNHPLSHLMTFEEVKNLLNGQPINQDQISNRKTGYIVNNKEILTDLDFTEFCRRQNLLNPEDALPKQVDQLKGLIACTGIVTGKAKIIFAQRHLAKIQEGDILISTMTNANYNQAFKKAGAVITDEGGVTSHAAILARELKKPCIIGTKIATKIFQDGDLLQVDATSGVIYKL